MNRIRERRQDMGWTQANLSDLLGVRYQAVSKYEIGALDLDTDTIRRLCGIFGCTADYLICRSDVRQAVLSQEDAALLAAFRDAPAHVQDGIRALLNIGAPEIKEKQRAS